MTAADHFEIGKAALMRNKCAKSVEHFSKAQSMLPNSAEYRSYYGLALGLSGTEYTKAVGLIQSAASVESNNPVHYMHLARVHLAHEQVRRAVTELYQVLRVDPTNRTAMLMLQMLDLRALTPLPFLERSHVLNRLLGRLRHRFHLVSQKQKLGMNDVDGLAVSEH